MKVGSTENVEAFKVFEELLELETIIGIPCIIPLLEHLNNLIKISQKEDIYVLEFIEYIETTKKTISYMYSLDTRCTRVQFSLWQNLVYGEDPISWLGWDEDGQLCIRLSDEKVKLVRRLK